MNSIPPNSHGLRPTVVIILSLVMIQLLYSGSYLLFTVLGLTRFDYMTGWLLITILSVLFSGLLLGLRYCFKKQD